MIPEDQWFISLTDDILTQHTSRKQTFITVYLSDVGNIMTWGASNRPEDLDAVQINLFNIIIEINLKHFEA